MPGWIVTPQRLKLLAPRGRADILGAFGTLQGECIAAGLTTPRRVSEFLANSWVETWAFTRLEENLNYSAQRLREVWPKRFPSLAFAERYANDPQKLAEFVYGGRHDLGNTQPGDGWLFRGSGYMQTTGRDNFRAAGHESDPDTLRQPIGGLRAALQYWTSHRLNGLADAGKSVALREAINGSTNGMNDVLVVLRKAEQIFG